MIQMEMKQKQTKSMLDRPYKWRHESLGLTLRGAMDSTKVRGKWRSFIRTHRRQMAGVRSPELMMNKVLRHTYTSQTCK